MTLLELLVKELSCAWPLEADGAVQDRWGQIWFYKSGKPYYTGIIWATDPKSIAFDWVHCGPLLARSDDYATAIVTREQYESAIAAQQPAWNGEGLPPVGVKCEIMRGISEWRPVVINFISENLTVFKTPDDVEKCYHTRNLRFRPLRTEADRKREETINALISLGVFTRPVAEKTIDAIAAGKIPGVELTK